MSPATDRRPPPRSDARRTAILTALDRWLQDSDLDTINVADISREAGVTRSAFYFYFENKAAAVAALMAQMVDETLSVSDEFTHSTAEPQVRVHAMLTGLVAMWDRHRHLFKAMLDTTSSAGTIREIWDDATATFVEAVAAMIRAERTAGRAPEGLDAAVLASILLDVNSRMLERLTLGGVLTRNQLVDGIATVWLSTIYGITSATDRS